MTHRTKHTDDMVLPFLIEHSGINGRIVRMGQSIDTILKRHPEVPYPAQLLLGQFLTLGAAMAMGLKYEGVFTLQAKGDGPVSMMVADVTSDGNLRGYIKVDKELPDEDDCMAAPVLFLLEKGYMAFTLDQGQHMERYQGIVEIRGKTLEDAIGHYFAQSDQLASHVHLAAAKGEDGNWRSSCIMLQKMPEEGGDAGITPKAEDPKESPEEWRRAVTLMKSATIREMTDANLSANDLLYRLFHEDGVRIYDTRPLDIQCRCSREKVSGALIQLNADDLEHAMENDKISVTCEFCNTTYEFQ